MLDFTITLDSPAPSGGISIDYRTKDGTAKTTDHDYESTTGTLKLDEGETKGIISIPIKGDTNVEEDETFTVILSNPNNAVIDNSIATGTILNDDTEIPPLNVCEGMFPGPLNNVDPAQSGKEPGIVFDGDEEITGTARKGYVITDAKNFVNDQGETCDGQTPCKKTEYWADQYTFTVNGGDGSDGDIEASKLTIDSGKQYDKFESKDNATITFNNDITIYVKEDIEFEESTTLNINGNVIFLVDGDVKLGEDNIINIKENASLRIYASGKIDTGSSASGYTPTHNPEQLAIFSKEKIKFGKDDQTFSGLVYSEGDVTLSDKVDFTGAITASGKIETKGATIHGGGYCQTCITVGFEQSHYSVKENIEEVGRKTVVNTSIILSRPVWYDVSLYYSTEDGTAKVSNGDYEFKDNEIITIHPGETNVTLPIAIYNDTPIELDENFFVQLSGQQPNESICLSDIARTEITIGAQEDSTICFEDNFDNGLDDRWRVLKSSGDFTPGIVNVNGDNRLRITPGKKNIATVVTKDYEFETSENLIIVEFDYYAYGGCEGGGSGKYGADGIVNVLFDSSVGNSPISGGSGGSMGYAQRQGGDAGFEGGWLGLGIDEYGNFGNCNEGRINGLPDTSCDKGIGFDPQDHTNTAVIRGDGNGTQGYEFLEGVELHTPVADKSATDYYSGRYKMTVDARDPAHLYIRLERDLKDGNGYQVIIDKFDAKDSQYNQGVTPATIRYAISGGTGGGCNNHEIGWIRLKGNCGFYGPPPETGPFDAWDTFRHNESTPPVDKNISTKIAKKAFELTLASLNQNSKTYETKPGEESNVEVALYKPNSKAPLSNIVDFDAKNLRYINGNFTVKMAHEEVVAGFKVCATNENNLSTGEYNYRLWNTSECSGPIVDCLSKTNGFPMWHICYSSDSFAVRPDRFDISLNSLQQFKAGVGYPIDYRALNNIGENTIGYSQEQNNSFEMVSTLSSVKPGCQHQQIDIKSNIVFENGFHNGDNNKTYFNTVGDFNLTIREINGSEFAKVDSDDTPYPSDPEKIDRFITEDNVTLHITPANYNITGTVTNANTANHFTYLSNIDNTANAMAATLNVDIQALIADGSNAENYESDCYADSTDFEVAYNLTDITPNGSLSNLHYLERNTTLEGDVALMAATSTSNSRDFNISFDNTLFASDGNGSATIDLALNFDRSRNLVVNPFKLTIDNVKLTETDNEVSTQKTVAQNATFLYARAKATKDIYDNIAETSVTTPVMVQVYCDKWPASTVNCPGVDVINGHSEPYWWLSLNHNENNGDGNIALQSPSNGSASVDTDVTVVSQGVDTSINVTKSSDALLPMMVNIDLNTIYTDDWLIYNPYSSTTAPTPFYRVRFIGTMDWAGHSDAGHVVDTNASIKKNRKLGW